MSMEIYYFSGTGNTLHIARELKRRMPEAILVPIISALKNEKIETKAETVGVVFPIHAHTFPLVVKEFLKKVDLKSASYVFALSTRECADSVFKEINEILKEKKKSLDASFAVNTPQSYVILFPVPSPEEVIRFESVLQKKLDEIQIIITSKQTRFVKTGIFVFLLEKIVLRFSTFLHQQTRYFGLERAFYADIKCIGCGTCEKICLSEKIGIENKKPVWRDDIDCTFCFACISYCPVQAIQAKRKRTTKKGRYHHPEITAKDIAEQKVVNK